MRLGEALQIMNKPAAETGRTRRLHLVCGFTPLHLETFARARARLRFPDGDVLVATGLFGDLEGNLQRASEAGGDGAIVALEWSDLDERLGFRAAAGWGVQVLDDVLAQIGGRCARLEAALASLGSVMPVAVAAVTLPLPPVTHYPPAQTSLFELDLRSAVTAFLSRVGGLGGVRLVSESQLSARSPHAARHDAKLDLHAGFPYSVAHADAVADLCVECLFPAAPKKGLITDLDETLWKGILGDAGPGGVSWSLEDHAQPHALYQQLLASLAEAGVLIAVASKNDPELVRQAFERRDMLLGWKQVFPMEAGWGAKSAAVGRILRAWNVGAESVVFVDDSPMELAEVSERYPEIESLRFPDDPAAVVALLHGLRARFGKSEVREEDRLRLRSLESAAALADAQTAEAPADFLARLGARITLEFSDSPDAGRAFELVNKTNQFNLNGCRYEAGEWASYFRQSGAFLITAAYQDRFGPLGKIAVLAGRADAGGVRVDTWVMSCRAFSRHIEFQLLRQLFGRFGAPAIRFSYRPTNRNGPLREFFSRFFPEGFSEEDGLDLTAAGFERACPPLFHEVSIHGQRQRQAC